MTDPHFAEFKKNDPWHQRQKKFKKFFDDPKPIDYIKMGYNIIPVPFGQKKPVVKNWNNLKIDETNVDQYFTGKENIGLVTGKQLNGDTLLCIDLDSDEAVWSTYRLPETGMVSSRCREEKAPIDRSHLFYDCNDLENQKFLFRDKNLFEIRNEKVQTIIPPSLHPSGQKWNWDDFGEPLKITGAELKKHLGFLASICVLKRLFPKVEGTRDDVCLALSGYFCKNKLGKDAREINLMIKMVALSESWQGDQCGNTFEYAKAEKTLERIKKGERVKGRNALMELLKISPEEMRQIDEWFGLDDIGEDKFKKPKVYDSADITLEGLKRRPILFGNLLMRGEPSAILSYGGSSKSTFSIHCALAIANGEERFGNSVVYESCSCLIYNREDGKDELKRRIFTCAKSMDIDLKKMPHKLHYISGKEQPLVLVETNKHGHPALRMDYNFLKEYLLDNDVGVLVLDPVVSLHRIDENSNMQMDYFCRQVQSLAEETNTSVLLVHHTNKSQAMGSDDFEQRQSASRGASGFINATRLCVGLKTMNEQEAKNAEVHEQERHLYVGIRDVKNNYFLMTLDCYWFKRESIKVKEDLIVGVLKPTNLHLVAKSKKQRTIQKEQILAKSYVNIIKGWMTDNQISLHDCSKQFVCKDVMTGAGLDKVKHCLRKFYKAPVDEGGDRLSYEHRLTGRIKEWLILTKTPKSPF